MVFTIRIRINTMNSVEKKFLLKFNRLKLIYQPNVLNHKIVKWRPDFLDEGTGIYYEVVGTRQSFYEHKRKGHFDFMLKNNLKLMIVIYIKEIRINKDIIKKEAFKLLPYEDNFVLSYK
jgi:hypothetical protein